MSVKTMRFIVAWVILVCCSLMAEKLGFVSPVIEASGPFVGYLVQIFGFIVFARFLQQNERKYNEC